MVNMLINKKMNYSYKFPKLSEYGVKLFSPLFMLVVFLIAIMAIHSSKEIKTDTMMQIILLIPTFYLSVMILNMIFKIENLIRSIINVCEENSNLSQKGHIYKNSLLVFEGKNKKHIREKKMAFAFIVMTLLFFLSKRLMIDIYYLKWGLGFSLIIILFVGLRDISRFFYNLANASYQVIIKDDKFAESISSKNIINWKAFEYKWLKALSLNVILFLLTIIIYCTFKDFKGTISSVSLLIASIITFRIALDVNNIVKSNLAIMGEYDEHIKNKLGMSFCQSEVLTPDSLEHTMSNVPDMEVSIPTLKKLSEKINMAVNKIFKK